MNLSLISTFIIGSILLVSLVGVNLHLGKNSIDSMNDMAVKENIKNVAAVLSYDFRKIGYGTSKGLLEATPNEIIFYSDLQDDGVMDQVTWQWDQNQPVTETLNPGDYVLTRSVTSNGHTVATPIKLGIVKFNLSYYNAQNQPTVNLDDVRKVEVKIISESADPVDQKYMKASWDKIFVPMSLDK